MAKMAITNQFMSYEKANNSKHFGFNKTYRCGRLTLRKYGQRCGCDGAEPSEN